MSKYSKYDRYEKEEKGGKKVSKWVCVVAVLLAVALSVAAGVGSSGFRNWNVAAWFNNWGHKPQVEQPVDEDPAPVELDGGGMVLSTDADEESDDPITFASYSLEPVDYPVSVASTADSVYTITATVAPDDYATNTAVEWESAWKNSSSNWANGKAVSNYVTVTPKGESYMDSKTITLTCLQSFGEPIILTAKCKYDENITASIQIDYAARLIMQNYSMLSNMNAEGAYCSLQWGGETDVTFELGSASKAMNLYPTSIAFLKTGYSTLDETYTVKITHQRRYSTFSTKEGYAFNDDFTYSHTIGNFTMPADVMYGVNFPTDYQSGSTPHLPYGFSAVWLGKSWKGYWKGNQSYTSTLYEIMSNKSGTGLQDECSFFNLQIQREGSNNKWYFSDITLEIQGEHATYTKTTKINITKALASVNLSDVTIGGGDVIL